MTVSTYSNKGGRPNNEDSLAVKPSARGGVFVLADGLGGHRMGETASQIVVQGLLGNAVPVLDVEILAKTFDQTNTVLLEKQRDPEFSGMKTTAVYLSLLDNKALWGHVGDSRLYHLSGNQIAGITKDHSVSFKKHMSGEITYAQINQDDDRSSLLSVFGSKDRFYPEFSTTDVRPSDAFLLCSDGFWEYIYNEEILIDYLKSGTAKEWAQFMLLRHIARTPPGNDNFSLITIMV